MPDFKRVYLAALKVRQPRQYHHLERTGHLEPQATAMADRAQAQFETMLASLRRQHPGPASAPMQAQHLCVLASQAEEIAIEDLLPT